MQLARAPKMMKHKDLAVKTYMNPFADIDSDEEEDVEAGSAAKPDEEQHELHWDDDMLQDLVFAFEACDLDGNGVLDASELLAVVHVLGSDTAELDTR